MGDGDRTVSDRISLLKSWIPWRSEPARVSRDFWMPDQSCRVCYECDSQFTLFNRRHHCRLCGRIFCAKCTSNWIPTEPNEPKSSLEERDKIRVCNYCFKQWEKDLTVPVDNGIQVASLDISTTSPSATSFLSTKSSETCDSSCVTFYSLPQSSRLSPHQSPTMETTIERQSVGVINDHVVDIKEQNRSQEQFEFCQNRTGDDDDDDDDEFAMSHIGSRTSHFPQVNDYYGHIQCDEINSDYKSRKVHPDGDAVDSKSMSSSPLQNSFDFQNSEEVQQIVRKSVEHDIGDECEAPSSLYVAEDVNTEPVDFENNGVLWLPPEPEDEEDEREALLFEDDDDGDGAGEWGYLRNSSSFGSGESRSRDKSNEEHKKVMKNVVEGHFRALVAQLLQVENLLAEDENDKEGWLEIITALSWEAATLLKPDTSKGGQMDPGGYVKVKCLASGLRSESSVVKGIVCKKNVAHRRMTSKIEKPRLLILGGALEYQRISNALSSFDTLLQQEMDHLKMAVAKIDAHNPDILLVEKSVSRYAQEYLLAKDISLVLNIKRPLLERIARCTGAQIVSSIDHLSSQKLGYCDMFHVERFSEEHGSAGQNGKRLVKTLMYFEGCPKPLGCTILLRGANGDELKKVKHVVQYGVFAAYHLALETSFLADEGASLPELPLNSPITVALPDKSSNIDRSISTISDCTVPASEITPGSQSFGEPQRSNSVPTSDMIKVTTASIQGDECSETYNFPAPRSPQYVKPLVSSSVKDFQHSSLNEPSCHHASEDRRLVELGLSSEAKTFETDRGPATGNSYFSSDFGNFETKSMHINYCDIDATSNVSDPSSLQPDQKQILEEQPALKEEFPPSPSDHQSILVSLSSRCVWKGTVCERSHLFRIKYYGSFDKPLGRFLRDHLFDQNYICRSCEMPAEAHVQRYTHRQGTLTISVKKLPEFSLPGEKDRKIWMWHRCLKCPRTNGIPPATRRIVMSDAAWELSFGMFLELSFSNNTAVASCGHSLQRDCLRFYGFGQMVACFRYASIDVHSVYLPPAKLDFYYESQEWIERELNEVVGRAELLFSEVLNALRLPVERKSALGQLNSDMNFSESRSQIADLEGVLQKEKSEFEETLQKISNKEAKKGQPVIDILELNRLRRQLILQSYMWDHHLIHAASLDVTNQPNYTVKNDADTSSTVGLSDKLGVEDHREEDCGICKCMPFVSVFRSLNKNFLGNTQKLDTLGEYDPVYISSFRESELQSGAWLLLPVGVNDTVVPVYNDEPSSIISYALVSPDYILQLSDEQDKLNDTVQSLDVESFQPFHSLHASVSFVDDGPHGKVKYTVTCYYAKHFEGLRRICCPDELDFVRSLSRCKKWGAHGGESKTLDDRFIIKQMTKTELESFMKLAPDYFKYLSESIESESPTCLVKILGIYQVTSKHLKGGKETKMDVLVMENHLFGRNLTRVYDLKGSSESRYNPDSSGSNKVLLDQNLIEAMPTSPIFVGNKAKSLLERAVGNDTAFLSPVNVMDYSLLVGVDEEKHELVVGIIDFMKQYTWDKHIETWFKASGILGGPKNVSPTVISPEQYKKRFRKAMSTYFLMIPDQRSPPTVSPSESQTELSEDNSQNAQSMTSAD